MSGPRRSGNTITDKLRECLPYIAQGMTNRQISIKLSISIENVRNRVNRLMEITGCATKEALIEYAKAEFVFIDEEQEL